MKEQGPENKKWQLEKGDEFWKKDMPEEEIAKIKDAIGKDFENVKFRFTKYFKEPTDLEESVNRKLKKIISDVEAALTRTELAIRLKIELVDKAEKLSEELDNLTDQFTKEPGNMEIEKELREKEEEFRNFLYTGLADIEKRLSENN
jgi:hypothetical protein